MISQSIIRKHFYHMLMDYYDRISSSYMELHYEEQAAKHRIIKEMQIINDDDTLLDIAHGAGIIKGILQYNTITGVDSSANLLKMSQCETIEHDFNNLPLPFASKSFDYCLCISAIHHSNHPKELAEEMLRIARKGIIISILKKSPRSEILKQETEKALGTPEMERDAFQDLILTWRT
jgi:ubiquinone/menaquinone biosynthesis C-methylase UbiE